MGLLFQMPPIVPTGAAAGAAGLMKGFQQGQEMAQSAQLMKLKQLAFEEEKRRNLEQEKVWAAQIANYAAEEEERRRKAAKLRFDEGRLEDYLTAIGNLYTGEPKQGLDFSTQTSPSEAGTQAYAQRIPTLEEEMRVNSRFAPTEAMKQRVELEKARIAGGKTGRKLQIIHGPEGATKVVWVTEGQDYTPPTGWSTEKPEKDPKGKDPTPPMYIEQDIGNNMVQKYAWNSQTRKHDIVFGKPSPKFKPEGTARESAAQIAYELWAAAKKKRGEKVPDFDHFYEKVYRAPNAAQIIFGGLGAPGESPRKEMTYNPATGKFE